MCLWYTCSVCGVHAVWGVLWCMCVCGVPAACKQYVCGMCVCVVSAVSMSVMYLWEVYVSVVCDYGVCMGLWYVYGMCLCGVCMGRWCVFVVSVYVVSVYVLCIYGVCELFPGVKALHLGVAVTITAGSRLTCGLPRGGPSHSSPDKPKSLSFLPACQNSQLRTFSLQIQHCSPQIPL